MNESEFAEQMERTAYENEQAERARQEVYEDARNKAFEIIRKNIKCERFDILTSGCERAECACALAACEIAAYVTGTTI